MDGISAASGVFAVVSLAIELPTAIQGLVDLCRSIKDAPDDIQRLVGEINTVAEALGLVYQQERLPEFERIANKALQQCYVEILKLRKMLNDLAQQLDSPSSRKRGLGRWKTAMKKPHIDAMRSSIETVKSTLKLVQDTSFQISFQSFTERRFENIDNRLLEIMKFIESPPPGVPNSEIRLELEYKNESSGGQVQHNIRSPTKGQRQSPRVRRIEGCIESWNLPKCTPLGAIQNGVVKRKNSSSNAYKVVEYCRKWRVYPSALLSYFGMRYGAMIEFNTDGWQYVISPFNAVPENAKIFEFCRQGDLIGVQSLLKLGQASLRDRDPLGRTPLWVASQSLQLDVAEFLLREGADIHEGDWAQTTPRPPLLAIQDNDDTNSETKRSFIALYEQYHPGDYDKDVLWRLVGRLIMFYRPTKPLEMTLQYRRDSALKLMQQIAMYYFVDDSDAYSHIAYGLLSYSITHAPLHWALRHIKGTIVQEGEPNITSPHMVHHIFTRRLIFMDLISAKLIAEKTNNFHPRWYPSWEVSQVYKSFTPTSLALYHPAAFVTWRKVLLECEHNMTNFVEQELLDSPLADDGWTAEALLNLFMSDITAEPESYPTTGSPCDRCGDYGYNPHFHLPWRRYLRAVRNGHRGSFDQKRETATLAAKDHGSFEVVCSNYCDDKFCVAGMYESNAADGEVLFGPDVPVFVSKEERELLAAKAAEIADAECPSKKMPGAFVE